MDNKKYWLDDYGLRYWTSKLNKNMTAMRSYHWCDRVLFLDETDGGRKYTNEITFTKFLKDEYNWHPMSKKQYDKEISDLQEKHKK